MRNKSVGVSPLLLSFPPSVNEFNGYSFKANAKNRYPSFELHEYKMYGETGVH